MCRGLGHHEAMSNSGADEILSRYVRPHSLVTNSLENEFGALFIGDRNNVCILTKKSMRTILDFCNNIGQLLRSGELGDYGPMCRLSNPREILHVLSWPIVISL